MAEKTLEEIQSIKKDIETLILQNESEQQKIKLEKPKGLKKPKAPKKTKTRKQLAEEAKAQEKQNKKEKAKLELAKKIAQKKADQRAKIAADFNSSIMPQNVFDFLFTLDQTFERDCKTRAYMYGSCLVKLALGHMAMNDPKSAHTPSLEVLKKIIVNDNDITVASPSPKPLETDETVSDVEAALALAEWTPTKTTIFQRKPRDNGVYPAEFTNYTASIQTESKPILLEATVTYPGYRFRSKELIPLTAIKAYFANTPHDTKQSLKIGPSQYLIIEDPDGILEKTFQTGTYDYQLPDPDDQTDIHTGIFARAFGFYFKMDGILKPGSEAQKIIQDNQWAHYYFARKFFAEDKKYNTITACYKEMEQLIRKNLFSKKELTKTIAALSAIALLYTHYKNDPSKFSDALKLSEIDLKQDGSAIKNYCDSLKLNSAAEKMAEFLQNYYKNSDAEFKFSELFPHALKNSKHLDKPVELIQRIKGLSLPYSYIPQFQGRSTVNYYESKNSSLTPPSLPPKYSKTIKNEGTSPLHKKKDASSSPKPLEDFRKNKYSSLT
jgi:hypothetical protein